MKKSLKAKESGAPDAVEADIAGLILKVMQQISFLDKKVDALIAQVAARPAESRPAIAPFQYSGRPERHDQARPDFRDRVLHKAVCADCKKECEVPFRPTGNRPVYCKECFGKRKDDSPFGGSGERSGGGERHQSSFRPRRDERSGGREGHQKAPYYKKYSARDGRSGEKKRPIVRGRRKPKAE